MRQAGFLYDVAHAAHARLQHHVLLMGNYGLSAVKPLEGRLVLQMR